MATRNARDYFRTNFATYGLDLVTLAETAVQQDLAKQQPELSMLAQLRALRGRYVGDNTDLSALRRKLETTAEAPLVGEARSVEP